MGRRFHQYEMGDLIGRGAMGSVYRGRNVNLDSPVAIKVLHPALTYDQDYLARFELEARTAASIQSPNIVNVIDFGSENETYFIIMELIEGADLARIFSDLAEAAGAPAPLPPEICLLILEDVAYGLRAAHEKGIWHRDIKPSNIMLDRQGYVRVADFGLARDSNRAQDLDLTRTGIVLGTPSYMSPEQAAGEKLDGRTDVFSLGVVAYQWLTGHKPFPGDSPSEVLQKIITSEPLPLVTAQLPWITPQIRALLDGSLHKTRSKRLQSMDAFLAALRAGMESLDPGGGIVINRREYLRRFAQDPAATAAQLRHESVQAHLRRGLHLKDMGLDKLEDALYEFRYVRALEPTNQKAKEALRELERRREDSRQTPAGAADGTRVLAEAATVSTSTARWPGRSHPARRWLWFGVLFLVSIVAFLVVRSAVSPPQAPPIARVDSLPAPAASAETAGNPGDGDSKTTAEPPAAGAISSPESRGAPGGVTPPSDRESMRPSRTAAVNPATEAPPPTQPSRATPTQEAPAPTPSTPPRVTWSIPENVSVLIDGAEVWRGSGKGGCNLDPGRAYDLVVSDAATFTTASLPVGPLTPGQVHAIGPMVLSRGRLKIVGKDGMTVRIDGRGVATPAGSSETFAIGAEAHVLSICLPGRAIRGVTIVSGSESHVLKVMDSNDDCTQYKFTIAPDLLHSIAIF